MHNLRLIEETDYPFVRKMMMSFHAESPYKDTELVENNLDSLIHYFSIGANSDRFAVLAVDDQNIPIGIIAGYVRPNLFNGKLVGVEQVLWIVPEHRDGRIAEDLLRAFEFWAKKVGCTQTTVASLENAYTKVIDRFYRRHHYKPVEHAYVKDI